MTAPNNRQDFDFGMLHPARHRLFFDYDGTLRDFVPSHEAARAGLSPEISAVFQALIGRGFDVTIISGRAIVEPQIGSEPVGSIDTFFAPLKLPAAGLHGFQFRATGDAPIEVPGNILPIDRAVFTNAEALRAAFPALQMEVKSPYHLTLHFREVEQDRQQAVLEAIDDKFLPFLVRQPGYKFQHGEKIVEICPDEVDGITIDKGMALRRFMKGDARIPVFFGDDAACMEGGTLKIGTDESALAVARELGGIAVLVGPQGRAANSTSVADYVVSTPAALHAGLRAVSERENFTLTSLRRHGLDKLDQPVQ